MISVAVNENREQYQDLLDNILNLHVNRMVLEKLIAKYREIDQERSEKYIKKMGEINAVLVDTIKEYKVALGRPTPQDVVIGIKAPNMTAQRT